MHDNGMSIERTTCCFASSLVQAKLKSDLGVRLIYPDYLHEALDS